MHKALSSTAAVIGLGFVGLAIFYWMTPAGSLPGYIPGYEAGAAKIHFKHGLGSLILGLALFAYAWFQSGPDVASSNEEERQ